MFAVSWGSSAGSQSIRV